jgi:hypothetical protein
MKSTFEKEYKKYKKENIEYKNITLDEYIDKFYPSAVKEEEIILYSMLLPREIIESEEDIFCQDGMEYNVPKYIDMFNKRITGLLVCFKKEIRDKILITNPCDRPVFTSSEMELCSGEPNKPTDQDTYEALMTMEDKEIKFWEAHPEFEIPFLKECGMDWGKIHNEYLERQEREKELGIDKVRKTYSDIINTLTMSDVSEYEETGIVPSKLSKIVDVDKTTGLFVSKDYPEIVIGSISDIIDNIENKSFFENDESDIE